MIRFAIWSAVSTEAQAVAGDKVSLEVQEQKCRESGLSRGWVEVSGPYVVCGESRQRWVNLRDAESVMPELHTALEDAQSHKFDVLIMWDYNRLRDLLDMVSKSLSHYGVQIASVNQWIEPVQPEKYNPYASDMVSIVQVMSKMTSTLQNNDLRRKYAEAMPRRVSQRGLPANTIPFGYKHSENSKTPPTIVPDAAGAVIFAKNEFLSGKSTTQIAAELTLRGIFPKSGKWYPQTVKAILTNPFYAGILRWGVTRAHLDPRTGRTKKDRHPDPAQIVTGKGKHEPLWDEYTYHAIVNEFHARGRTYSGRATQRLTSLLTCGVCGKRLWTTYNHAKSSGNLIWRCSSHEEHVAAADTALIHTVINHIIATINNQNAENQVNSDAVALRDELGELQAQRDRIGDAYASGAFNVNEFTQRAAPLDDKIAELKHRLEFVEMVERDAEARRQNILKLQANVRYIPMFVAERSPQDSNYFLRSVIREIIVYSEDEIEIRWK